MRTIPTVEHHLIPLYEVIHQKFIPSLLERPPISDVEKKIFTLPARLGGLGFFDPSSLSSFFNESSLLLTKPLVSAIVNEDFLVLSI